MSRAPLWIPVLSSIVLLSLSACGGGGQGLRVVNDPVLVTSTSIPPVLSGDTLDHVIPLQGGCGGPYVLQVVGGAMPRGLQLDQENHAIVGPVLEDGEFEFTVQVTDTGCQPFLATQATFRMAVGVGELRVVSAIRDGNPVLYAPGAMDYNPDYPAIGATVYNDYTTTEIVVAGGKGPYAAVLHDDPAIPNDGPLPLGASVPPGSTSINGGPLQVGPGGGPFLITLRITDSLGEHEDFTFYWLVETPPIIFATDAWADGQAGTSYSQQIFVAEGVPPFAYELVEQGLPADYTSDKSTNPNLDPNTDVIYNPGAPPTVTPAEALVKIDASHYPSPSVSTTLPGVPPEGAALNEDTGSFSGIPRRFGDFSVHVHVSSTLVPNSFGQHAWGTLAFTIAPAPPITQDPAYTVDAAFTTTPPYARIIEALKGEIYNPDGGPNGLQILASGGVPDDGYTDAPHRSQTSVDPNETPGAYKWSVDWNPDGDFDGVPGLGQIAGMELTDRGVFRIIEVGGAPQVDDLVPQFDQAIAFTAADSALPDSLAGEATEKVAFGIGPDRIVVTTSTTSMLMSSDNRSWDDSAMTIKYVIPQGNAHVMRSPGDTDLTGDGDAKHTLPSEAGSVTAAALLTSVDLLRVSVNPTGYWDDNLHLNPKAARPYQNSLDNFYYAYYGPGYHGSTSYSSYSYTYGYQPSTTCVRLPACSDTTVSANKSTGVYTDGGKLHVFETSTHIGIFVIRKDGRIYVPAAFSKSASGYVSFGDNWSYAYRDSASSHSSTKIPQMTVSPDGRTAAFKLRTSTSFSMTESAGTTDILLISLTGERIAAWDDEVYKIVGSGSNGSSSTGQYLFASSLTLTNDYLYYLLGSGSTTYLHYKDHYIYRYELFAGDVDDGELLHPGFSADWTNSPGNAMQTPFQCYSRTFCPDTTYGSPDPVMYATHGYNSWESSLAPHPFRVNSLGNACALLAGVTTTATAAADDVLFHHVWVDYEGQLKKLSSQRRHTSGGGRGIALCHGPSYDPVAGLWGAYNGPTSRFEISDDGLKVAVVYFRNPTVDPIVSYSEYQYRYREDIAAYSSTDGSWGGVEIHEITGDSGTGTGYYTSPVYGYFPGTASTSDHTWRFGALTFTMAGDGLVFYGGYSNEDPDEYYMYYNYQENGAKSFVGSIYSYDFATGGVRNILAAADGGCNKTAGTTYGSYTFSETTWASDGGMIKPIAGFRSADGNFLYMVTRGAVNTTNKRDGTLIGVNVRSVNATTASGGSSAIHVNGHQDGRAFRVGGFPENNGFMSTQYPYCYLGFAYTYSTRYDNYYWQIGDTQRVAATDSGWVFFTSVNSTGSYSSSTTYYYGGAVNPTWYGYPYSPKSLFVFDPNVGGDAQAIGTTGWTSTASYQLVQGLISSDDGSCMMAVDSQYSTSHYFYYEYLTVFSGIELDASGDLVGTPTRQLLESSVGVGACGAFTPKLDAMYYAGSGGTSGNDLTLKRAAVGGSSTATSLGLPTARYTVLHAGR